MYFITTIKLPWDKFNALWPNPNPKTGGRLFDREDLHEFKACWGYYSDFEKAKKIVLENLTDIYENGSYNLAVIENLDEGSLFATEELWFSAKPLKNEEGYIDAYDVKEIDKPERFANFCGWALA